MKIKEIKIINQDQSTEIADIGANAVNVDYNDTTVKAELDKLNTTDNSLRNTQTNQGHILTDLQSQVSSLASGSPAGVYATVAALQNANPDTGVYIVSADGHIYSWTKNQSGDPVDLGVYQATGIADKSVSIRHLDDNLRNNVDSLFETSINVFNKEKSLKNKALTTWSQSITTSNYTYDSNGWLTSEPIPCNPGETYYFYRYETDNSQHVLTVNNVGFFNEDRSYNSVEIGESLVGIKNVTIPTNAKYFVVSISNGIKQNDVTLISKNEYTGDYIGFGKVKEKFVNKDEFDVLQSNISYLQDEIGTSKKAHIIFSFDQFAIDNRFTLMKQYGFPFTIALRGQTVTKEQYYEYFIDGDVDFSVYAGTGTKPTDYTQFQEQWNQWVKSLCDEMVEESGLYYPVMYSCANNKTSNILNNVCKNNGFKMCRAIDFVKDNGTIEWMNLTRGYLFEGINNYNYVPLVIYKSGLNLDNIKTQIDNAINQKKSIMLFTHLVKDADDSTITNFDSTTEDFTAILNYIKTKVDAGLCDVVNARQYYNLYDKNNDLDYKRTNMRNLFDTLTGE